MTDHKKNYDDLIKLLKNGQLNDIKNIFEALLKEPIQRNLGSDLLREACLHNRLDIVRSVIEHENKQALDDFNSNYGFIFWTVIANEFWDIARYFICELNMPLSWDLNRAIKQMDKDHAKIITHMFEMREIKQDLEIDLKSNELNSLSKKTKV